LPKKLSKDFFVSPTRKSFGNDKLESAKIEIFSMLLFVAVEIETSAFKKS